MLLDAQRGVPNCFLVQRGVVDLIVTHSHPEHGVMSPDPHPTIPRDLHEPGVGFRCLPQHDVVSLGPPWPIADALILHQPDVHAPQPSWSIVEPSSRPDLAVHPSKPSQLVEVGFLALRDSHHCPSGALSSFASSI